MTSPPQYPQDRPIELPPSEQWPAGVHRLDAKTAVALRTAEATGRPLLLRGLPGVGKSMTARAAAQVAGRPLLCHVINGRTEPSELQYRFDQVRRLADAQVLARGQKLNDEDQYLHPQALWWAFNWIGASGRAGRNHPHGEPLPKGWDPQSDRVVLLLDEIDKADPELPNSLLEAFASLAFTVEATGRRITCPPERRPLIIITTNEERDLPMAFLRRVLVHELTLPDAPKALQAHLAQVAKDHQDYLLAHNHRRKPCLVVKQAAELVAGQRIAALNTDRYLPGTSELLDLVAALAELYPDSEAQQRTALTEVADFVLKKSDPLRR